MEGAISQEYYSKKEGNWSKVAAAFIPPSDYPEDAVQLFDQDLVSHRYLSNSNLTYLKLIENEKGVIVQLHGTKGNVPIDQSIFLGNESDHFHFTVKVELPNSPTKLDYVLSTFEFNSTNTPSFVHTPGLKFDNADSHQNRFKILPGKDQIIGDRDSRIVEYLVPYGNWLLSVIDERGALPSYRSAMRTHPSWGEGSGVFTGLAEALRGLGGIYLDFEKKLFVGVDGTRVDNVVINGNEIHLKITNMLDELELPWNAEFSTKLRIRGLDKKEYALTINGGDAKHIWLDSNTEIPVTIKKGDIHL